ncbi:MAG: flagellar hook-length control protein FliK [Spirochaetes bacterium]|nr:flagellar hook-length control protein FliK [Spirochaetota bacterium]
MKEARDSSGGKKAAQGGREFSFACLKYENNIPNTVTKPDYQIHRSADEIFNDIVKQFSMVVKKGGGEAKVVLQPEVLGQVKLSLKLYNNEVNTFMVVDNQAVKELIMSRLNILEQNLLEQGFSLGSFEVEVKDRNTEPETAGKDVKKGPGINNIEDEDQDLEISRASMSGLPWISTVVNITV